MTTHANQSTERKSSHQTKTWPSIDESLASLSFSRWHGQKAQSRVWTTRLTSRTTVFAGSIYPFTTKEALPKWDVRTRVIYCRKGLFSLPSVTIPPDNQDTRKYPNLLAEATWTINFVGNSSHDTILPLTHLDRGFFWEEGGKRGEGEACFKESDSKSHKNPLFTWTVSTPNKNTASSSSLSTL